MFMHLCSAARNAKRVINMIKMLNMLFIIQFIPLNKIHTNFFLYEKRVTVLAKTANICFKYI